MNGNPYYVDPWGGYNEGMKNLGSAFDTHQENRRRDELLKIQQAEEARKQSEYARQEETRQGLGAIDAKRSEMTTVNTPNPEFQNYQALKAATMGPPEQVPVEAPVGDYAALGKTQLKFPGEGIQLPAQAPPESLARTEQVYGNDELQRQKAQYLEGRGDWAGLKGMENAIDVTSKVDARSADMTARLHKVAMDARAKGESTESIRATLKTMADNINRMQGKQVFDPSAVDKMDFSPRGDLIMTTLPDGTKVVSTIKTNGELDYKIVPQDKSKDTWTQLPEKVINGVLVMPQQNNATGEIKYNQVSRVPENRSGGGGSASDIRSESALRKEFSGLPEVKNYKQLSNQYSTIRATMENMTGEMKSLNPNDQAIVMTFNKILDPTSVVRESEFARTPENMSILNRASALLSRWQNGGILNTTERQAIVEATNVLKQASKQQYDATKNQYRQIATDYGFSPARVLTDAERTGDKPPPTKKGPAVGDVQGGYRFKGGNPSDKANWVKEGGR